MDEPCTLTLSPQRLPQNAILLFLPVKSTSAKKSATKFLCVKTSSGRVVATTFLYLTVHRRIAGDVPIYLKFALKLTHPFRKRRFRQISLNSASAVRASEKVQLSLIGSRQCVFHQAIDKPCALPVSPPEGGSKREFFFTYFALPFLSLLQVIVDTSNLVCRFTITTPSGRQTVPEMGVVGSRKPFKFWWASIISPKRLKLE